MTAARRSEPQQDPLVGRKLRVLRGRHAGATGLGVKSYRGRIATADTVHIEQPGSMPGWYIAVPVEDVEVVR